MMSGVISTAAIVIAHIWGLIAPSMTTHEPPSRGVASFPWFQRNPTVPLRFPVLCIQTLIRLMDKILHYPQKKEYTIIPIV